MKASSFPALVQGFFTDRLVGQLNASPHTVASYRDTFQLLLRFAAKRFGRAPSEVRLEEIGVPFLGQFLDHLQRERGNSARTRNVRLAAVHSFFRYVSFTEPSHALDCQRVLAIPAKRHERKLVAFLTEAEAQALIEAPDPARWVGRRDRALLRVAVQTGIRNSEITSLRCRDVELGTGAHVRCLGKGRKMRCTPLRSDIAEALRRWFAEQQGAPQDPVFPSSRGGPLSADALQRLVAAHATTAQRTCPSLRDKVVTPHTLRHTAAMDLLRRGVDLSVIALWLGHESTETTQIYLHADMELKERALGHASPTGTPPDRFRANDRLLAFLESL
jgi:site-specific recombinase XerD